MEMTYPKVLPGGLSSADPETGATIAAEAPEPPVKLNAKEKKLWLHVTAALEQYGLVHRTDGMMLTIICKTFCDWAAQEEFLQKLARDNGSYYVKTPNGYEQPHQAYYVARDKKRELLKWLPEAALTIPSFHKLKAEQITPQGDLFDDPVEQFRQRKAKIGLRAIPGGKPNGGED
ncbi:P27 family phage terminase small subunit [uncultured Stutzerimonas sp.]|uniref:P27 family phage terminase small subunit n=1 Tax=uncultured Stutzerimonas sp. TaxID=2901168 RepID=UPI0032B1D1D4|tara:strand:+ start:49 stop:573 length:525 start_codon:yes stop_codon:yes gene_type:complete